MHSSISFLFIFRLEVFVDGKMRLPNNGYIDKQGRFVFVDLFLFSHPTYFKVNDKIKDIESALFFKFQWEFLMFKDSN